MNEVAVPRYSPLRAALIVVAALAGAGVLIGLLWAWLAPPAHGVIALTRIGTRVRSYLGTEGDHLFLAAFLILGMLLVLAVVGAVLVWQWRAHRGPVMVAGLAVGCAAATATAAGVGAAVVRLRYGTIDVDAAPVTPDDRLHYVTEAPAAFFGHSPLQIAVTLLFPAAVAALVYALIAVSAMRDDLGAWPPVEPDLPTGRIGTTDAALPVGPPPPSH